MKNNKRLIIRSIILGLMVGLVLLEVKKYFNLPFWSIFIIILVIFIISSMAPVIKLYNEQKKLHQVLLDSRKILEKDNNPREFLRINDEIYNRCTDDISRLKTLSNMIVAYDMIDEYNEPLRKLNQIETVMFTSNMKEFYFNTKVMLLFKANRSKEAVDLMEENAKWFNRHRTNDLGMESVFFYNHLMKMIYEKRFKEAKEILDQARSVMGEDFFQEEYDLIKSNLNE